LTSVGELGQRLGGGGQDEVGHGEVDPAFPQLIAEGHEPGHVGGDGDAEGRDRRRTEGQALGDDLADPAQRLGCCLF
jgi:hypothetical protein